MSKIITIGSATMDVFVETDEANIVSVCRKDSNSEFMSYPYGSKIDIHNFSSNVGGGGINTACNFANLGFDTSAIFKIGKDFYSEGILDFFKSNNVKLDNIIQKEDTSTGFSIILVSFQGDRTVLAHRGANAEIKESEINFDAIKEADFIYRDEIKKAGLQEKIWQYFAVLTSMRSVGVMGDERTYDYTLALRGVTSVDGMTADWARIPYDVLEKISTRIVNEVGHINRVVYDITSKPPATIEWE